MKTKIITLIALIILLLGAQHADAKIRRVGYGGTPITNTDYTDLQSAHDAAVVGDTILIYPGSWYATYSKKLTTIGYGYFIDTASLGTQANKGLQNITGALSISVTLATGSSNAVFEGLDGFSINDDQNGETLSGIVIKRCNIGLIDIRYNAKHNNWQILQCYINTLYLDGGYGGSISSLSVNNCIVDGSYTFNSTATQTGQFTNCILGYGYGNFTFSNGSFIIKNSIFLYGKSDDANCVYQYDLFNTDYTSPLPSGTGNIGVNSSSIQTNVFVGYNTQGTYSNDGLLALKAGSPAKGKGESGIDMGIFGGANPYQLSGIPPIPAIYKLTAPSTTTSSNPYTITLSVRSNN